MTTKLEFTFQAMSNIDPDGNRHWIIDSNILPATAESDPGSTPETKSKEQQMALAIQNVVVRILKEHIGMEVIQ